MHGVVPPQSRIRRSRLRWRESARSSWPGRELGVEGVAQGLAQEGEAERGDDDGQPARDDWPGRVLDVLETALQDRAPGGGRRPHAQPKEAHACLDSDHYWNVHESDDQNRAE